MGFGYKDGSPVAIAAPATIKLEYAYGDRKVGGITQTSNGISWTGDPTNLLLEPSQVYWTAPTSGLDADDWVQYDFDAAVTLQKVTFEQANTTSHGTWQPQVKIGGTWTSLDSTITWGGAAQNEYAIDASKQADCTGWRMLGSAGGVSSNPFQYEIRFWCLE